MGQRHQIGLKGDTRENTLGEHTAPAEDAGVLQSTAHLHSNHNSVDVDMEDTMDTRPLTQDEVTIANTPCGSDTDSCPEYGYGYVQTDLDVDFDYDDDEEPDYTPYDD